MSSMSRRTPVRQRMPVPSVSNSARMVLGVSDIRPPPRPPQTFELPWLLEPIPRVARPVRRAGRSDRRR